MSNEGSFDANSEAVSSVSQGTSVVDDKISIDTVREEHQSNTKKPHTSEDRQSAATSPGEEMVEASQSNTQKKPIKVKEPRFPSRCDMCGGKMAEPGWGTKGMDLCFRAINKALSPDNQISFACECYGDP